MRLVATAIHSTYLRTYTLAIFVKPVVIDGSLGLDGPVGSLASGVVRPQEAYVDSAALAESQRELQEERAALGLDNEPAPSFEVEEVDDWEVKKQRVIQGRS